MDTPWETIWTSSLCSFWNQSTNSCSVGLLGMSKWSHRVHSTSPYWDWVEKMGQPEKTQEETSARNWRLTFSFFAAIGSENPKKGRARLTNPFW